MTITPTPGGWIVKIGCEVKQELKTEDGWTKTQVEQLHTWAGALARELKSQYEEGYDSGYRRGWSRGFDRAMKDIEAERPREAKQDETLHSA